MSRFRAWVRKNQKYAPVIFFICGFIWDTLTLGRIDRLYDRVVLFTYMLSLSYCLYLYNLKDDGRWKGTFFERYEEYLPLAIQFFLGGLCSAYVIYFSRSVSFTKTFSFFIILVVLLFANELLKKRISNKYLQFSAYFFMNFTFCTFYIPVLLKHMSATIFVISGILSLSITVTLIIFIYYSSPSTRREINKPKLLALIAGIYLMINGFYFFRLIPPVPLALDTGIVAYNIERKNGDYEITHAEKNKLIFWDKPTITVPDEPDSRVYVFASVFAPTDLKKSVAHQWEWKNPDTGEWVNMDRIPYSITGGRDNGYRGFTYKSNILEGEWRVEVITTDEEQVIGRINFYIQFGLIEDQETLITETI